MRQLTTLKFRLLLKNSFYNVDNITVLYYQSTRCSFHINDHTLACYLTNQQLIILKTITALSQPHEVGLFSQEYHRINNPYYVYKINRNMADPLIKKSKKTMNGFGIKSCSYPPSNMTAAANRIKSSVDGWVVAYNEILLMYIILLMTSPQPALG